MSNDSTPTNPPQDNRLEFSYNWNGKLECETFTSLRLSGRFEIGQTVEIWLKQEQKGPAMVIDKVKLDSIYKINNWVSNLDTGYKPEECRKIIKSMYPRVTGWENKPIYLYLFKYLESPLKGKKKGHSEKKRFGIETGPMVEIGTLAPGSVFLVGECTFVIAYHKEGKTICYISGQQEWVFPEFLMVEPVTKQDWE